MKFTQENKVSRLIRLSIKTNQILWNLEDLCRLQGLNAERVAEAKRRIDKNNQVRNDLINKIDQEITNQLRVKSFHTKKLFYSESPGMIIDRLAILFIKQSVIGKLLTMIREKDLKETYAKKSKIVSKQINQLSIFLDVYLKKLKEREVFFEVQQPLKIYNDKKIKKYINASNETKDRKK